MKKLFLLATAALFAVSCDEYDDSALRGRVDEIEDKIESHEKWLEQLDASVKSLNDANRAFTAMLNGGLITAVEKVYDGDREGWKLTITTAEGTKDYTVWDGAKGDKGEPGAGEQGEPGTTPVIG
ncbi:MAG: hypothetical protein J1D86_02605, partial [Alistipes sp.]|nr:hypothetical protein [Alistipes sp.]